MRGRKVGGGPGFVLVHQRENYRRKQLRGRLDIGVGHRRDLNRCVTSVVS